jgi:hypothetical protein
MTCNDHLAIAKGLLLKSVAVMAGSDRPPEYKVRAIKAALADLDAYLQRKDHQALVGKSAWLIHLAQRG